MLEDRLTPSFGTPSWVEQGPGPITGGQTEGLTAQNNPVAGAVEAIAAHPTNPDVIVIGTVNGGIWTTSNATTASPTWTPRTDNFSSLSIGAIAYSPADSNVLYAGTGSFSSGSSGGAAIGVLKSTDGGASWTQVGGSALNNRKIRSILPTTLSSGQVVLVAAQNGGGVFRSSNGGTTFTSVSGIPAGMSAFTVVADGQDPNTYFASVGIVAAQQGVYRSTDGGVNWTDVSTGITGLGGAAARIELAAHYDPADSSRALYAAVIAASSGELSGVFRSTDRGNTWTPMDAVQTTEPGGGVGLHPSQRPVVDTPEDPGGQGSTHFSMVADRTNEFVVYVGGDRQPGPGEGGITSFPNSIGANNYSGRHFRGDASQASGSQWYAINANGIAANPNDGANGTSPHADSRDMVWDANGNILESDDGGIYRLKTPNVVSRLWESANGNLRATEFYSVAYDSVNDFVFGGTQDVGSPRQMAAGGFGWTEVRQGDGGIAQVDDSSLPGFSIHYGSAQNIQSFFRQTYNNVGGVTSFVFPTLSVQGTGQTLRQIDGTVQFIQPWEINAVAPTRLLFGTTIIYESTDQGDTLTRPNGTTNVGNINAMAYGGKLSGVNNPDVAWIGTSHATNKLLLRTTSGGPFNTVSAYTAAGGGSVEDIVLDPDNWQRAYVLDFSGKVFRTTDAGATWTNLTSTLGTLSSSLQSITFYSPTSAPDDEAIFVAGLGGVFATDNPQAGASTTWIEFGTGLPNYLARDLHYYSNDNVLLVGGFGRGAWTVPNLSAFVNADTIAPTVTTLNPTAGSTTIGSSLNVDVTFSEAVLGVDATDMVLSGSAAGGANVGTVTNVGGNTWRFPISGLVAGALNISLAPDVNDIEDLSGNDLSPRPTNWNYTVAIGDRFEANDSFATATNLGSLGDLTENGLSVHIANNDDYYRLTAVQSGNLTVTLSFLNSQGNVDLFVYDAGQIQIGSSTTTNNTESVTVPLTQGQTYYIKVIGAGGAISPRYDMVVDGRSALGAPVFNFDGTNFTGALPSDSVGDIGVNHYIQATNGGGTTVTVYNKATGSPVAGFTNIPMSSLVSGVSSGRGDPVVLFDQLANRWLLAEIGPNISNPLSIFISNTADPTQGWTHYDVDTVLFPDYPKFAVWQNAYYVTSNESSTAVPVYALNRTKMLAGQPLGANDVQRLTAPGLAGFGFQAFTPADNDGAAAPAGAPGYFMRHRDDEAHNVGSNNPTQDFLEVWRFTVDFSTPANSSFTQVANIAISEFSSDLNGFSAFNAFPQPNAQKLDPLREVIMNRLQYRNFGSYEVLVGNFVTDVNDFNDHGGVRWFELRKVGAGAWTLFEEGTIAPDANNRWMGAVSMDGAGNIALAYSITSPTVFPGLRYFGRRSGDTAGTMTDGEYTIVDGVSSQASFDRWGDYFSMGVDPVDDRTFWHVGTYMPAGGSWRTHISAFKFDSETIAPIILNLNPGAGSTIAGSSANVDVTFSEPVLGVDVTDMVLSGPASVGATIGTPTNQGGNTWRFPLSSLSAGALNISLAPDVNDIEDVAGNDLSPRPTTWSYTVSLADITPPTVTARSPAAGATLVSSAASIDVTFSEAVVGVDASDLVLSGSAAGGASVGTPINLGSNVWRFPVSALVNGTLNISLAPDADDIEDTSGNDLTPRPTTWSYTVDIDTTPPTAPTITGFTSDNGESNTDSLTNDSTPTFTWTASTDVGSGGLAGYWWSVDNPTPQNGGTFTTALNATPTVTVDGAHTFYVVAIDGAGNLSTVSQMAFTIDITVPTVTSTTPADGSLLNVGPTQILVDFSEAMDTTTAGNLLAAHLTLGGVGQGSATVAGASWLDADTARFTISGTFGTGLVTVQLTAGFPRDRAGNALAAYSVGDFTIDSTPPTAPTVTGLSTDAGESSSDQLTNDTTPTFTWTASVDASGIAGYWWSVDDATPESGGTFTTSLSATAAVTVNGAHVFYVRALDGAGNLSSVSQLALTIDTVSPTVVLTIPLDGSTLSSAPSEILVDFSEAMDRLSASNLQPSDLTLGGSGLGSATVTGASWLDAHTARFTIGGSFADGPVTVQLISGSPHDQAGNALAAYTTGDFTIDTTAPTSPTVTGLSLDTGESSSDMLTSDTTPTFTWSASIDSGTGLAGYFWSVDDPTPESGGTFTAAQTATPTVTANGPHVFYVRAKDNVGNFSGVGQLAFNIDTAAPTVMATTPADGSIVSSGPAEILVDFSEAMDTTSAFNLQAGDLTLGGAGLGTAAVTGASWIDSDTARFTMAGSWSLGLVTVQLTSGLPRDRAGNAMLNYTTGDFTIVDAAPPTVPVIAGLSDDTGESNTDGVTSDTTPIFTWSASTDSGGSGLAGYYWSVDDATPETGGTLTTTLTAAPTVTANGPHIFYVRAVDGAGNLGNLATMPFTIDTLSPTVASTTPLDGGTTSVAPSEILIDFSEAMDRTSAGNLSQSDLTLGGPGLGSAAVTAANWIDADTARFTISGTWSVGLVTVRLTSGSPHDRAGNPLANYTGGFTIIDATPPTTPIVTGFTDDTGESNSDRLTSDTTPTFSWSASTDSGGSGLAGYWWAVDDSTPETGGTFTTGLSATPTVTSDGPHVFYVRSQDGSGNVSASVGFFTFEIDTVAPMVSATTPQDGITLANGPNQILVSFSERMETNSLAGTLILGGPGRGSATVTSASWLGNNTAKFTIGGSWSFGLVTIQLTADSLRDAVGNILVDYTTGDFTIPFPKPGNTSVTPPVSPSHDDTPTINWSPASNATSYELYAINSVSNIPVLSLTVNATTHTPTTPLAPGAYLAWVRAIGPGGQGDWSLPSAFTILAPGDNRAPGLPSIANQTVRHSAGSKIVAIDSSDADNDTLTPTAVIRTVSKVAFDLDQQLGLTFQGSYFTNTRGAKEKYIFSTVDNAWYFILPDGQTPGGAEVRKFNKAASTSPLNPSDHPLAARLSIDFYNNPALLHDAVSPPPQPNIVGSFAGNPPSTLTLNGIPSSFAGFLEVRINISDGFGGSAAQSFLVEVNNPTTPTLQPIPNKTVSHAAGLINVGFVGGDADGDLLTPLQPVMVTVQKLARDLDQQLLFSQNPGGYFTNTRGGGEKYIYSNASSSWYYLIQDPNDANAAELHKFNATLANSPLVARLGIAYLNDPSLLHDAPVPPAEPVFPAANFTGSQPNFNLAQAFPTNFVGDVQITLGVSDGLASASQLVLAHIINSAPTIAPAGDANGNYSIAHATSLSIDVTDSDADALTINATAITLPALAFQLDQQYDFVFQTSYYQNAHGQNEKWIWSNVQQAWFSIQANGELRKSGGPSNPFGQLIAVLDVSFWNDPSLLWNAAPTNPVNSLVTVVSTQLNATTKRITFTPHANFVGRISASITAFDGIVTTRKTFFINVT